MIHSVFVSRCRSYIRSEGFTYTKTGTVEQFDNCKEDILSITGIGDVTYTPEFHFIAVHRAKWGHDSRESGRARSPASSPILGITRLIVSLKWSHSP